MPPIYWRSLMAGEQVIAVMLVIVMLGLLVDIFLFGKLEEGVRRRWGFGRP